jgi:tRNA U34 5-methylaminomethyl-2-thiouridine-forming methyltransferase MnmC
LTERDLRLYAPERRANKKMVESADGTLTMYSEEFDECYHSTRDGALKESLYKHIIPAFTLAPERETLRILDICFGLGYNTWATIYHAMENGIDRRIEIFSPELDEGLVKSLKDFPYPEEFSALSDIIREVSLNGIYDRGDIRIEILFSDAREIFDTLDKQIDIVYQDPFSPRKNPALWTKEYFSSIRSVGADDMVLTTYSSATPVRMGLYENGFHIYTTPRAEGIRPGTIASPSHLELPEIDMELKMSRNPEASAIFDRDIGL